MLTTVLIFGFSVFTSCLATTASSAHTDDSLLLKLFNEFRQRHHKTYANSTELSKRFGIFKENLINITRLKLGHHGSASFATNHFADLTDGEFFNKFLGHKKPSPDLNPIISTVTARPGGPPPEGIDWRQRGAVTSVKNQGHCGSCWAFTTAANIESLWKIKTGKTVELSPQQLVDCDDKNHGCNGGNVVQAIETVKGWGGLKRMTDYPYLATQQLSCTGGTPGSKPVAFVNGSLVLPDDENAIAQYVHDHGPVAVAVNAKPWRFYQNGVMQMSAVTCDPTDQNHAVLVVGYGTEPVGQRPFWIIKNSWGPEWGEQGYIRLARGSNTCGIKHRAKTAVIR